MNLDSICTKVQSRISRPEGIYREFAILIPLIKRDNKLHLLFEVRSKNLNTQPGEVCFPGGGIEEGETPKESAIRETHEELNIPKKNIEVIGDVDFIVTPFNVILHPYLGILRDIEFDSIDFNHDEVGNIFTVPLEYFLNKCPDPYYVNTLIDLPEDFPFHKIQNGKVYDWRTGKYPILFYEYDGHVIWGMTARIVKNLIDIITK